MVRWEVVSDGGTDGDHPRALRAVAEQLATEAAAFVRRRRGEVFGAMAAHSGSDAVTSKSTPTDPVTIVDKETERLLRERLAERRPGDHVLGEEEGGPADAGRGELTWVLDPIDGTVNFVYDIAAYAVSVAVQRDGESLAGAVADVANGVVYSAARGDGASYTAGGAATPLRCSAADAVSLALLGTGFAYAPQRRREQAEILVGVLPHVRDVRRIGSCALDLCMVAAGQLDAYYEDGVNVWDWAAGALIAAEAGALVRLPDPAGAVGGDGLVVAAAPGVADGLDDVLRRVGVLE
jgi:myo-inositol-1(or 4)-monophosphatase